MDPTMLKIHMLCLFLQLAWQRLHRNQILTAFSTVSFSYYIFFQDFQTSVEIHLKIK